MLGGEGGEFVPQSTNASMSIIEVEAALREKARTKFDNLRQARNCLPIPPIAFIGSAKIL